MACKILSREDPELQCSLFIREYKNLRTANRYHHPNIVQLLAAFHFQEKNTQRYNFIFPLAIGTLRHLIKGRIDVDFSRWELEGLWTQFEGLASAVAYLHKECNTAHRDIKASNILICREHDSASLVAKITDFGLAVDLKYAQSWAAGTLESRSALKYGAPEMRKYQDTASEETSAPGLASRKREDDHSPQPSELRAADVWTLGCVFTLLLTFLVSGVDGEKEFRHAITTIKDNITTDELDDGVNIKVEVIDWLFNLGRLDLHAQEIGPLIKEMLAVALKRPSSAEVWDRLLTVSFRLYVSSSRLQSSGFGPFGNISRGLIFGHSRA